MKRWMVGLLGLCLAVSGTLAKEPPLKMLYLGLSKGFAHSSVGPCGRTLEALGKQTGLWTTKVSEDIADLSPANIGQWDLIFFFTTGDLGFDAATKKALLDWIDQGGGFAGFHSATDTYYDWADYGKLMGGYFAGHPWNQVARFKVEDPDHPAFADLAPSFEFLEEIYVFRDFDRTKQKVLVSLDNSSVDASRGASVRPDLYYANAWCKDVGQGRMMYNGFGHHDGAFADPKMHQMIIGMVKWLAKLDWQSDPAIIEKTKAGDVAGLTAMVAKRPEALRGEPVRALGAINKPAAADAITKFVAPDQPLDLRLAALNAMGRSARFAPAALVPLMGDAAAEVRRAAVNAVGRKAGEPAEKVLLAALRHEQADVRAAAVQVLAGIDTPSVTEALLGMVKSGDAATMRTALTALMGRKDERIAAVLIDAAKNPTEASRSLLPVIVERLSAMAGTDEVFAILRGLLTHPDGNVRAAAVRAVGASGRAEAGGLIAPRLFDRDNNVANAANEVTAKIPNLDLKGYMTPYIRDWLVVGPFDRDHDKDFGPETNLSAAASYDGQDGKATWKAAQAGADGLLNLRNVIAAKDNCLGYAWTVIDAPKDCEAQLRLGSDDGAKVWLNGKQVLDIKADRGLNRDGDRVNVSLKAGANTLLVKVDQGGGDWSLTLRLGSEQGGLDGLKFALPH